jgi:hypothetical protein
MEFVNKTADSIERLELLVMLIESPDRWWDAATAGHAVGVDPATTQRDLEHLATRNLLAVNLGTTVRYRFEPGNATVRATSEAFAEVYRNNPRALYRVVVRRQNRALRDFADAFRIRRNDDR